MTALVLAGIVLMLFGGARGRPATQAKDQGPTVVFDMEDPAGDDYGPGTYTYPTHKAFAHPGLFDLLRFVVSYDIQNVYFDCTFGEVTNPWNSPEGFSHQLIDIYIDSMRGQGATSPLRPGPNVVFARRFAWDFRIKVIAWGGSRLYTSMDDPDATGVHDGLMAELLPDKKTIRIQVPVALIGKPNPSWSYYVLVGSQDAFGRDDYRPVMEKADRWVFGGGSDLDVDPNVIDILAPGRGLRSQERMLASYNINSGAFALIYPVGKGRAGELSLGLGVLFLILLGVAGFWLVRRKISS
ncbi:MAG TPA: hypothetical protein GX506_01515 [Firmicutes bacterium]|nr:hypothetical protein [Bacillota bacterium]